MANNLEKEPEEEDQIDMVNINSINFNSKCSVKTENLKTKATKVRIIVPY